MVIKIEDNLNEVLLYLEVLNYTWTDGKKPTEYRPHGNCNCLVVKDNYITSYIAEEGISFEEFKRQNPIRKEHIRSGMVVEYRDGQRRLVVDIMGKTFLISNEKSLALHTHEEDLTCHFCDLCIDKVFIVASGHLAYMLSEDNPCVQIWGRPNPVTEVTLDEIAKKFNIDIKQLKIKK